jgi:SAM-dependent methyltransferase
MFRIEDGGRLLEQEVLYSHETLAKLLIDHNADFHSVLDIGSHWGNVSNVFKFLGKKTVGCEISPIGAEYADYHQDFLDIAFPEKFDAIWCSAALEHQRNLGIFLNKIFDDLRDGGILALTIPLQVSMHLDFGHCNLFSPLIILYQLTLAGFDCRDIRLRMTAEHDIAVILRKRYNGIRRDLPFGSVPATDKTDGEVTINGKVYNLPDLLGIEVFKGMAASFPPPLVVAHNMNWPDIDNIGWPEGLPTAPCRF